MPSTKYPTIPCIFPFFTYQDWLTQKKAIFPNWRTSQLPENLRPKDLDEFENDQDIELSIHYHLAPLIFPDVIKYLGTWGDKSPALVVMVFQESVTPREARGILLRSVITKPSIYWCGEKGRTTFQIRDQFCVEWGACMLGIAPLRPEAESLIGTSDEVRISRPFEPGEDSFFMRTVEQFGLLKEELPKAPQRVRSKRQRFEPLF